MSTSDRRAAVVEADRRAVDFQISEQPERLSVVGELTRRPSGSAIAASLRRSFSRAVGEIALCRRS